MDKTNRIAAIIQDEVHWFNGWRADEISEYASCLKATRRIVRMMRANKRTTTVDPTRSRVSKSKRINKPARG